MKPIKKIIIAHEVYKNGKPFIDDKTGEPLVKTKIGYALNPKEVNKLIPVKTKMNFIPYIYDDEIEVSELEILVSSDDRYDYKIIVDHTGNIIRTVSELRTPIKIDKINNHRINITEKNNDGLITSMMSIDKKRNIIYIDKFEYDSDNNISKSDRYQYSLLRNEYDLDKYTSRTYIRKNDEENFITKDMIHNKIIDKKITNISYDPDNNKILTSYYYDTAGFHTIDIAYAIITTYYNNEGLEEIVITDYYNYSKNEYDCERIKRIKYEYYEED